MRRTKQTFATEKIYIDFFFALLCRLDRASYVPHEITRAAEWMGIKLVSFKLI